MPFFIHILNYFLFRNINVYVKTERLTLSVFFYCDKTHFFVSMEMSKYVFLATNYHCASFKLKLEVNCFIFKSTINLPNSRIKITWMKLLFGILFLRVESTTSISFLLISFSLSTYPGFQIHVMDLKEYIMFKWAVRLLKIHVGLCICERGPICTSWAHFWMGNWNQDDRNTK